MCSKKSSESLAKTIVGEVFVATIFSQRTAGLPGPQLQPSDLSVSESPRFANCFATTVAKVESDAGPVRVTEMSVLLNREGGAVAKKLVYRLYREEGLIFHPRFLRRRRRGRDT